MAVVSLPCWSRLVSRKIAKRYVEHSNQAAFDTTVEAVSQVSQQLLTSLTTNANPRNREVEAARGRKRAAKRFGRHQDRAPLLNKRSLLSR